jgi:hypothetical protein
VRAFRTQRGLAGAAAIVIVIIVVLALVLGRGYFSQGVTLEQRGATDSNMRRIADAVVAFAALNRRLPCPAGGAAVSGLEVRSGSSCTNADGTVPWESLAISRELAIDGWGRRISYRVFSGAQGFTRDLGIDVTNCSSNAPVGGTAVTDCSSTPYHYNHRDDFLLSKGLTVNDQGSAVTGISFALIGHGESGLGAFGADSGVRTQMPNAAGNEYLNTQGSATFQKLARNVPTSAADPTADAAHFDDEVLYVRAVDLIQKAGLDQRAWPAPPASSVAGTFNLAAIQAESPGYTGASQFTGLTSLDVGTMTITATAGGAARQIGFRTDSGVGGIGVIGGSSSNAVISSALNEVLTINFGTGSYFDRVDIAFNEFSDLGFDEERVQILFWRDGVLMQTVPKIAWRTTSGPSRCLIDPLAGNEFDRIDIRPISNTGGGSSSFTVAGIHACTSWFTGTCQTSIAGSVPCP